MKKTLGRIKDVKINKMWMWLLYIDFILPLCLFLLAYLLNKLGTGFALSRLFHSYNLYILSPIPNLQTLTGILGLIIHTGAVAYALLRRDLKDAALCLGISTIAFLYIFLEVNYQLSFMLKFF